MSNAPHTEVASLVQDAIDAGFSLVPLKDGKPLWGVKGREEHGRNATLLGSYAAYNLPLAVDWDAAGCTVLNGDMLGVQDVLGKPVYIDCGHAVYRADHPGNRGWRTPDGKGKFLAKTKQWFPVVLSELGRLPDTPTDLTPILGKAKAPKKANGSRKAKLKDLQRDVPALLAHVFPGDPYREEGDGWRVSTGGMKDNISVTPAASGDLIFKDFGEPPAFDPGDALSVMDQLSVTGKPRGTSAEQESRPQVTDTSVGFTRPAPTTDEKRKGAQRVWRQAMDLNEDEDECAEAHGYLKRREVSVPEGAMVRFEPECQMGDLVLPCLIAAATADLDPGKARDVTAIQRISMKGEKRTMGKVEGAVNVSGKVAVGFLGVAEGVVTALAAQELFGIPFVATLGTGGMKDLVLPDSVESLLIAADHDEYGQGQSAARALARRYAHLNPRVVMPSSVGKDFADADFGVPEDLDLTEEPAPRAGVLVDTSTDIDLLGGTDALGESAFAHEFLDRHGGSTRHDGRYSDAKGAWVEWKDGSWQRRHNAPLMAMANVIRTMSSEDEKAVKSFDKSAVRTGSLKLVAEACERREWDLDPYLLGLPGGLVLDLRTGDTRPQAKADYITRSTNTVPADNAGDWPALVRELCSGDESRYEYVKAIAVDCLMGLAGKDLFPLVYGPPGTGKGTVWNAVARAIGSYSKAVEAKYLLAGDSSHRSWLAGLLGARMALTSEVPPGATWNGPLLSTLTGGDEVDAHFMAKDHFTFLPAFRLVGLVNDLPTIPTNTSGLNRRVRVIPFTNVVAGEGMGEDVTIRDRYFGEQRGQVLRWLADSAREVNAREPEHRYPHCQAIADATAEYVKDRSDFDTWANEAIERTNQPAALFTGDAHTAYLRWAEASERQGLNATAFGLELSRRMGSKAKTIRDGQRTGKGYPYARLVEVSPSRRKAGPRW